MPDFWGEPWEGIKPVPPKYHDWDKDTMFYVCQLSVLVKPHLIHVFLIVILEVAIQKV